MNAIEWILDHLADITVAVGALLAAATVIVGLTKTEKDDEVVRRITIWWDKIKGLLSKKA